jgi:6-phosphogluconolactonase (cycloisomerase 2 family)
MRRQFLKQGFIAALCMLSLTALPGVSSADNYQRYDSGVVYTTSNAVGGNAVLAFTRDRNGGLQAGGAFPTGGAGTGGGLGNQGAVVVDEYGRWLLAVNAGSNSVSLFAIKRNGLQRRSVVSSGGVQPVSVTVHDGVVYVLNAGSDNVSGFRIRNGTLAPIAGSTRALSSTGTAPAQVQFSPDGESLVVTEKATNKIDVFEVRRSGLLSGIRSFDSATATPFGFAFARHDFLLVSEAAGGAPNASVLSSYRVGDWGALKSVSPSVATNQSAACWVVVTRDNRYAFVSNTGSGSISAYTVRRSGKLELQGNTAIGAGTGPIDMVLSGDFLYVLNGGTDSIVGLTVGRGGTLDVLPGQTAVPDGSNGLAAL